MSMEPAEEYTPLGVEKTEEKTEEEDKLTVEQMVDNTIGSKTSKASIGKFIGLFLVGIVARITGPFLTFAPIFTGFLNYKDWECISERCDGLAANFTGEPPLFYSRDTICDNALQPHVDFKWTIERTSYALEWGLICSNEDKGSNLKSVFFFGAFLGLITGTVLFDRIGRKTTCLLGLAISSLSCMATYFVNSYDIMLPLRIVHGFGTFIVVSGVDLLSIEFTPSNMRNLSQILSNALWNVGSFLLVGISYSLKDWHHIFLVQGCVLVATAIPILLFPESPRFHLVKGKQKEARTTFKKISRIFKTDKVLESTEITYQHYDNNYLEQIKDFKRYPVMLKNTVVLMLCWLMISTVTYGLMFSWGKLGADIYQSLFFANCGGLIAKVTGMNYYIMHWFGRKRAAMINFAGLASVFFLAIPTYGVRLSDKWSLDNVVCLFATLFIAGVWAAVALLTKELSPTSHRGMIYCTCSATARIGAFIGPYLTLLYNTLDARIVLAIFGGLAAFATFVGFFNSDSTRKPIPSTPDDLVQLHPNTAHSKLQDEEDT